MRAHKRDNEYKKSKSLKRLVKKKFFKKNKSNQYLK